jgi:hypothetical protein
MGQGLAPRAPQSVGTAGWTGCRSRLAPCGARLSIPGQAAGTCREALGRWRGRSVGMARPRPWGRRAGTRPTSSSACAPRLCPSPMALAHASTAGTCSASRRGKRAVPAPSGGRRRPTRQRWAALCRRSVCRRHPPRRPATGAGRRVGSKVARPKTRRGCGPGGASSAPPWLLPCCVPTPSAPWTACDGQARSRYNGGKACGMSASDAPKKVARWPRAGGGGSGCMPEEERGVRADDWGQTGVAWMGRDAGHVGGCGSGGTRRCASTVWGEKPGARRAGQRA